MKLFEFMLAFGVISVITYVLIHIIAIVESLVMSHFIPGIIVLAIVNIVLWGKEIINA